VRAFAHPETSGEREDLKMGKRKIVLGAGLFALGVAGTIAGWSASSYAGSNTQLAELYQLQAAFHADASVHDAVNGDSQAAVDQRIRDMLSLWTDDGSLSVLGGTFGGNYVGNGDPGDPSTCPTPSGNAANQGTLCTFFKYVAGSFKPANKFVSLSPSYLTNFDIHGNTATVYFQCHYFNVAADPITGKPLWTAVSHVVFDGSAQKVNGVWLLSRANGVPPPGIPVP
jgi:hypothetical protein